MSQENVEMVRSILTAWERADFSSTDWAHQDIEYTVIGGPAEMRASVRAYMGAWEDYGIAAEEYRVLDERRVLVLVRLSGRGKISRLDIQETQAKGAQVWQIRDGAVVRLVLYWSPEQALADLGLAE